MEKTVLKMERKEKRAVLNRVKGCAAIILLELVFWEYGVFLYFLLLLLLLHTCTPFIKTLNRRLGLNFFFVGRIFDPPPQNNLSSLEF